MKRTQFTLRPRSGAWTVHPTRSNPRREQLLRFDMKVQYDGKELGGDNIQVVIGAPDRVRRGLDEDVALWLPSGWWVTLRNQFALAPGVAMEILNSISGDLSSITARASKARGAEAEEIGKELFATTFTGEGPAYWG